MKPLRIRIWMVIGMLIVLIVPRLFFDISGILERYIGNAGRSERFVHRMSITGAINRGRMLSARRLMNPN
ncbi:hypothetical protein [Paenibacillus alvei]|uniref:Uncharacterized protein n=1 Tax=Paenibacillus alvei TaxID=44250 RepID=A0AAP6ZYH8_PAEAL|nr:hypothetical protein [Paenibacillus alvei]NOJ72315.1 hypothetical protein [Paenibacillus alvei]